MNIRVFLGIVMLLCGGTVFGYICNTDKAGGISITIDKIEKITEFDTPTAVKVVVKNDSASAASVSMTANSIETVSIQGEAKKTVEVAASATVETTFQIIAAPGTYSAHYPIHIHAECGDVKLHPVQVVETDFGARGVISQIVDDPKNLPLTTLVDGTGLFLPNSKAYRVVWNHDGKEPVALPIGFSGNDPESMASFAVVDMNRGGVTRGSFSVHPPWKGGTGNVSAEYRLKLPESKKIVLSFFGAMRDVQSTEPESDGITYRVRVDGLAVCEKHIAAKNWVPVECDLTKFAGKEILLGLESDPGPKRDCTCDNGFWGDPLVFCGEKPKTLTAEEKQKLFDENFKNPTRAGTCGSDTLRYAISFGHYGLLDGVIGFGNENKNVQYDGLNIWIEGQRLGSASSGISCGPWKEVEQDKYEQIVKTGDRELKMLYTIRENGPALQIGVECSDDAAITKIEFGPATQHAKHVYFGHGYCVEEPEAFQLSADGHVFSTSHIGFDFENGLSLLMASTFPPDYIAVDPKIKKYTMGVHPGTTFTLLPGTSGAMDCAIRYRPICDKKAAPGVKKKAGRFALDWWGGTFKQHKQRLQELIDYGVTDVVVIAHNWQHWGYDNRLPDIWPPRENIGTIQELQEVLELCKKHDILYGLHDNYIDFYPDADGFNYDMISFEKSGVPRKGWNNYGIDAQAYHFRPDKIMPFIERNFDLMTPHIKQTTYFVDVFSSIYLMDFWDRDGNLHSRRETRDYWCKAFDTIRERLGDDNPTISEAGNDFLIGHLDGADCQFLTLSEFPGDFRIMLKCKKWARVPWYAAVNHTRFSLHGVGYDSRYAANRGYDLHGYSSDDMISAEILTGHPGQVGWNTSLRDTVRKYWLTQPVIRELADKEITDFEFAEDESGKMDIHKQKIEWSDGSKKYAVSVNLGKEDWSESVDFNIPQYGFMANRSFESQSSSSNQEEVEKAIHDEMVKHFKEPNAGALLLRGADGQICEIASEMDLSKFDLDESCKMSSFINPRNVVSRNYLPTIPIGKDFRYLGDNKFQMDVNWKLFRSMKDRKDVKDYAYFLHLEEPQYAWFHKPKLVSVSGGQPPVPVSQWDKDQVIPTGEITLAEDIAPGTYNVLIGLWDEKGNKQRVPILGLTPDNSRVKLGRLTVDKKGGKIVNMSFEPEKEDAPELFERLLPNVNPSGFGNMPDVIQPLAYRMEMDAKGDDAVMTITPLPGEPASEITLHGGKPRSIRAVDRTGKTIREVPFEFADDTLKFTTQAGEFSYVMTP